MSGEGEMGKRAVLRALRRVIERRATENEFPPPDDVAASVAWTRIDVSLTMPEQVVTSSEVRRIADGLIRELPDIKESGVYVVAGLKRDRIITVGKSVDVSECICREHLAKPGKGDEGRISYQLTKDGAPWPDVLSNEEVVFLVLPIPESDEQTLRAYVSSLRDGLSPEFA